MTTLRAPTPLMSPQISRVSRGSDAWEMIAGATSASYSRLLMMMLMMRLASRMTRTWGGIC